MILLAKIKYIYSNKIALIKWHYLYSQYSAMAGIKPLNIDHLAVIIILSCLPLLIQRETLSLSLSYTLIIVGVLLYLIPFHTYVFCCYYSVFGAMQTVLPPL